ncbi:MAG: LamG-like jellyroll fold domain-containing protein [Candidatus Omnitrophota bacterium]
MGYKRHKKAFTIIELLIIFSVIVIIIGISIPRFKGMADSAAYAKAKKELVMLSSAVESFSIHNNKVYPVALANLVATVPLIVKSLPLDPFKKDADYGYYLSPNGKYYIIFSAGFNGVATIGGIDDTGTPTGSVGDDVYVSNGGSSTGGLTYSWSMNEGSGKTVGEGLYSGQIVGNAAWTDGKVGAALDFDGTGSHVSVPDSSVLDLTTQGTVAAWIYADSIPSFAGIIHKGDNADFSDEAYSLQFWTGNTLALCINPTGTSDYSQTALLQSKTVVAPQQWYYVVGTWDSSGMSLYVNGALDSYTTNTAVAQNSSGSLNIGSQTSQNYNSSWLNMPFSGTVDEVNVSSNVMTAEQVKAYYDSTK